MFRNNINRTQQKTSPVPLSEQLLEALHSYPPPRQYTPSLTWPVQEITAVPLQWGVLSPSDLTGPFSFPEYQPDMVGTQVADLATNIIGPSEVQLLLTIHPGAASPQNIVLMTYNPQVAVVDDLIGGLPIGITIHQSEAAFALLLSMGLLTTSSAYAPGMPLPPGFGFSDNGRGLIPATGICQGAFTTGVLSAEEWSDSAAGGFFVPWVDVGTGTPLTPEQIIAVSQPRVRADWPTSVLGPKPTSIYVDPTNLSLRIYNMVGPPWGNLALRAITPPVNNML